MAKVTISEGMNWKKTLQQRHTELIQLRNDNSNEETRYMGANATPLVKKPTYDVKQLDALITRVARELRLVDQAIKNANAKFKLDYEMDEAVLGQVE